MNYLGQPESVNILPLNINDIISLTQRLRLGIRNFYWQVGFGIDLSETGRQ